MLLKLLKSLNCYSAIDLEAQFKCTHSDFHLIHLGTHIQGDEIPRLQDCASANNTSSLYTWLYKNSIMSTEIILLPAAGEFWLVFWLEQHGQTDLWTLTHIFRAHYKPWINTAAMEPRDKCFLIHWACTVNLTKKK